MNKVNFPSPRMSWAKMKSLISFEYTVMLHLMEYIEKCLLHDFFCCRCVNTIEGTYTNLVVQPTPQLGSIIQPIVPRLQAWIAT